MEENILKELVKSRKFLKKKFDSIKRTEVETSGKLECTFKPLTKPLKKIVKLSNGNLHKPMMSIDNKNKNKTYQNTKVKEDQSRMATSTLKKKVEKFTSLNESAEDETATNNESFYSQSPEWEFNLTELYENKKLDTIYGPHKNKDGKWQFGNSDFHLSADKISIGNQSWTLTPGLYSLIFHKNPEQYDSSELDIYKRILTDTSAHRRNFDPNEQLKGNKGFKYKEIISKLFAITHTGKGLMRINLSKPNYINILGRS